MKLNTTIFFALALLLASCGGTVLPKDPVKKMQEEFTTKYAYTITLNDMDLRDNQYFHKYRIFDIAKDKSVTYTTTDWKKVSDDFFAYHEGDLGMEVLSKLPNGKYNNLVTPPGFTHFVGNSTYGEWHAPFSIMGYGDTTLYWKFNDDVLANQLELQKPVVTQKEYNEFQERFLYNRPYYGTKTHKDSTRYGTYSSYWLFMRPRFYQRRSANRNFNKPFSTTGTRGGGGFGK